MRTQAYEQLLERKLEKDSEEVASKVHPTKEWKALEKREIELQKALQAVHEQKQLLHKEPTWDDKRRVCEQLRVDLELTLLLPPAKRLNAVKTVLARYGIDGGDSSPSQGSR